MLMTEEEARQKWCPFARDMLSAGGNRMAYGGGAEDEPESEDCARQFAAEMAAAHPCIASDCMAWRWGECYGRATELEAKGYRGEAAQKNPRGQTRPGYCGLAGKPDHV